MNEEKARYIIGEIRNIRRYQRIIDDLNQEIADLEMKRRSLQEPSSPQRAAKISPTVSPKDITSSVLDMLSREQALEEERKRFEGRKREAERYRSLFMIKCPKDEKHFASDYLNCMSYESMKLNHNVTHPNRHMIVLIKSVL